MGAHRVHAAILFGVAGVFLAYISRLTLVNNDMFHAMSLFRETLVAGWVPNEDVYAFTPTIRPMVHHEWATGAVLYLATVTSGLGATGLMLLKYTVTAGIAAGCYVCARRRGTSVALFAFLAPIMFPICWVGFGTMRAQLFTLGFLTCLLLLLEVDRKGSRTWLLIWLPMYVLWLNMHGGFVVGVGVLGLHSCESFGREWLRSGRLSDTLRRSWHLPVTLLVMVPCMWINPYGTDYIGYLWHGLLMARPLISEWAPLWKTAQPVLTIEVFLISVGLVAYAMRQNGPFRLPGLAIVLVTAWLALSHTRHGSIYAVVWLCYAPSYLQRTELGTWLTEFVASHGRKVAYASLLLGCVGLAFATTNRFWQLTILTHSDQEPLVYPAGAIDYLAETGLKANVIVPFNTGAYVSWKLYPSIRVSFDSRYEATYPAGALEENFGFFAARDGWSDTLTRHGADCVLVRRISPVDDLLGAAGGPEWRRVYVDDAYSLFVKPGFAEWLPVKDRTGDKIVGVFP